MIVIKLAIEPYQILVQFWLILIKPENESMDHSNKRLSLSDQMLLYLSTT